MFGARVRKIPLLVVSAAGLCAVDAAAQSYACVLTTDGDVWTGACTSPDGEPLRMEVRAGESADIEWVGGLYVNDMGPLAFEIAPSTSEARGVIRTPFGWLWLDGFSAGDVAMEFGFDIQNEVPPGPEDVLILDRAAEILSDPGVWDREDDRVCEESDTNWSLYCALVAATIDVTGEARHRQPALQVVRRVVAEVGGDRIDDHRLMNYNNHPDTTFDDIRRVFAMARERAAP
jgi:hypothetical protein